MFIVVSFPWPTPSAYVQLAKRASANKVPARPDAHGPDVTQPELAQAGHAR